MFYEPLMTASLSRVVAAASNFVPCWQKIKDQIYYPDKIGWIRILGWLFPCFLQWQAHCRTYWQSNSATGGSILKPCLDNNPTNFTESQDGWSGKGPLEVISSNLCSSRDTQNGVPRATSRRLWEMSKEETPHSFSGQQPFSWALWRSLEMSREVWKHCWFRANLHFEIPLSETPCTKELWNDDDDVGGIRSVFPFFSPIFQSFLAQGLSPAIAELWLAPVCDAVEQALKPRGVPWPGPNVDSGWECRLCDGGWLSPSHNTLDFIRSDFLTAHSQEVPGVALSWGLRWYLDCRRKLRQSLYFQLERGHSVLSEAGYACQDLGCSIH